jgi:hypothetical protein
MGAKEREWRSEIDHGQNSGGGRYLESVTSESKAVGRKRWAVLAYCAGNRDRTKSRGPSFTFDLPAVNTVTLGQVYCPWVGL